ncbi:MAG TPA: PspC domain-containing protein [Ilumatobacteraceae bacterium]|nr:PspC domain-containing protein [Ilumatobacteraceae bacterium]
MDGTGAAPRAAHRMEFDRSATDRVLFGVCGGFARRHGIDTYVVRIALLVLTLTGGLGVVLYLLGWVMSSAPDDSRDGEAPCVLPGRSAAIAAGTGAVLMGARNVGLWPGDAIMIPAVVVASGSALLWYRGRDLHPEGDPLERVLQGHTTPVRALGGVALAIAGVVALVAGGVHVEQLPAALAALAMALAGAAVLVGPYIARLTTQLRDEERARIRDQERNDMAAHLHDSVLQTLALMQRAAADPRRMVMLARRQERELRSWLYDGRGVASATTGSLSARADEMAADVELVHGLPVDLVVVGDAEMTPPVEALLQAMREATVNAAKHARAELVSVYVEVEPNGVTAFVRDKGLGFVADGIGVDRHGVTMSIRDRLERVGGRAVLDTAPGAGTEWELVVPR